MELTYNVEGFGGGDGMDCLPVPDAGSTSSVSSAFGGFGGTRSTCDDDGRVIVIS
jgi:hypothetical protein